MHIARFHRIRPHINVGFLEKVGVGENIKVVHSLHPLLWFTWVWEQRGASLAWNSTASELQSPDQASNLFSTRLRGSQLISFPAHFLASQNLHFFHLTCSMLGSSERICGFSLLNTHFPIFLLITAPNLTQVKYLPHPSGWLCAVTAMRPKVILLVAFSLKFTSCVKAAGGICFRNGGLPRRRCLLLLRSQIHWLRAQF